jgi:WD40 repeat protein
MKRVVVLKGHSAAVTSVDWKILNNKTELLISCSDDQTIRIYEITTKVKLFIYLFIHSFIYLFVKAENEMDCKFVEVLTTKEITEWHTLTYLAVDPFSSLLACATQNGN